MGWDVVLRDGMWCCGIGRGEVECGGMVWGRMGWDGI